MYALISATIIKANIFDNILNQISSSNIFNKHVKPSNRNRATEQPCNREIKQPKPSNQNRATEIEQPKPNPNPTQAQSNPIPTNPYPFQRINVVLHDHQRCPLPIGSKRGSITAELHPFTAPITAPHYTLAWRCCITKHLALLEAILFSRACNIVGRLAIIVAHLARQF